jgi:hypothetical protein
MLPGCGCRWTRTRPCYVDPLGFFNMPILARLTLVKGAIHDIKLTEIGRSEASRSHDGLTV